MLKISRLILFAILPVYLYCQETTPENDSLPKSGPDFGKLQFEPPKSIVSQYEYNPSLDRYIYTETISGFNFSAPKVLTPQQYRALVLKERIKDYFKSKSDAVSGQKEKSKTQRRNLIPAFYVNSSFFESIFGGNEINFELKGSAALDLALRYQSVDNPSISTQNRNTFFFDFDQNINVGLKGSVGTRFKVNLNYDTQATFNFQNLLKWQYTSEEDDIVRDISIGSVSMPLSNSLIKGAQNLFGVSTDLQFGKTKIKAVFGEQRSQTKTVTSQSGGTLSEFNFAALDYDDNRHFFIAQYFRDHYDTAMENYPFINSLAQIVRIEVWVTNRARSVENVRNVVAIQDLGEAKPQNTRLNQNAPSGFFSNTDPLSLPDNKANGYNPFGIDSGSFLASDIRRMPTVSSGFGALSGSVSQGFDYAILENAKQLVEGRDFRLENKLGYISLSQKLSNDEVLAVAYQYTYRGKLYQVGEFSNAGVTATEVDQTTLQPITNNLVVKMLKSTITNVSDPIWRLMMKNIYDTGAYQLNKDDFRLNVVYANPSPVNYISPVDSSMWPQNLEQTPLINLFGLDRLDAYNNPQSGGDGFFDFVEGITIDSSTGKIIFPKAEPFGEFLYKTLGGGSTYGDESTYNNNQKKYVYTEMYKSTKAAALQSITKNKFQIKGRYKSESGGRGISLGAFNVARGSVRVMAGARLLQEGIDYTVDYQAGRVMLLDPSIEASNTPVSVSLENSATLGQQNKRFTGLDIEHTLNKNTSIGFTWLNLAEVPITQKINYGVESVNNSIFGLKGRFTREVPFFTRLVNKLPNIDTDVASKVALSAEMAYLLPNAPSAASLNGKTTTYVDDFEGTQALVDIMSPLGWSIASTPYGYGGELPNASSGNLAYGEKRAKLAWYTIDPIFYNDTPAGINDAELSLNETRRIFINEVFSQKDLGVGQTTVQNIMNLAYYPDNKGPYNNNANFGGVSPKDKWAGIVRPLASTNFEQSNIEYIQFWVLDPYFYNAPLAGDSGEIVINLGKISEDILKDGRKQYENGLPGNAQQALVEQTPWGKVPSTQSLIYAFDTDTQNRAVQDLGLDGLNDAEESQVYTNNGAEDPALDNYTFYLNTTGSILERYYNYNGLQGNSPVQVENNNRGSLSTPDVEDVDKDQTMTTIDSYYEYRIPIHANMQPTDKFVADIKETDVESPDGRRIKSRWIQYKVPIAYPDKVIGGIADLRSITHMRLYLTSFTKNVVLRFATLDMVRRDWRVYIPSLETNKDDPSDDGTLVEINAVNVIENEQRTPIPYVMPPGIYRETLNSNNRPIRQNEQSLSFVVCGLNKNDSRAVYKRTSNDFRQYKNLEMFIHAESYKNRFVGDGDLVAFMRIGTDLDENYYQIEVPLSISLPGSSTPEQIWPNTNSINVSLETLTKLKAKAIASGTLSQTVYYDDALSLINEFAPRQIGKNRYSIRGNPSLGNVQGIMLGIKNGSNGSVCGEVWFNELRLTELENNGGWAANATLDGNFADFANFTSVGRISTVGFGALDDRPNDRSREDNKQVDFTTTVNTGMLLPKKWGLQIPISYNYFNQIITPKFDMFYNDLKLKDRVDLAQNNRQKEAILEQSEAVKERIGVNFIGVKKIKIGNAKKHIYDIENLTFNYGYNQTTSRDFEIRSFKDQYVKTGVNYQYSFKAITLEPFKKITTAGTKYLQWLRDFNLNLLPSNIMIGTDINRNFKTQQFRDVLNEKNELPNLPLPISQQRNFLFNLNYSIAYSLTRSLQLTLSGNNNSIITDYYKKDVFGNKLLDANGDGVIDKTIGIWDNFWSTGEPNTFNQNMKLTYKLPIDKLPFLKFVNTSYSYSSDFQWMRGSSVFQKIAGESINTIQNNANHNITSNLDFTELYRTLGLLKTSKKVGFFKTLLMSIRRVNGVYGVSSGTVLPGYTRSVGLWGTLEPGWQFVFGDQSDIRYGAARQGMLTTFDGFNDRFRQVNTYTLKVSLDIEPIRGLLINVNFDRAESGNYEEAFQVGKLGQSQYEYQKLMGNNFGNFKISSLMIGTAFDNVSKNQSETFESMKRNRIVVANRLAQQDGLDLGNSNNIDNNGFPKGYGPGSQKVIMASFLSAYSGTDPKQVSLKPVIDIPMPNWAVKYTGLMNIAWFKSNFNRISLSHGYVSSYNINSYISNLNYDFKNPDQKDPSGNRIEDLAFKNVTMSEEFNPLIRIDFETKKNFSIVAEMRRRRLLSLSLDNHLVNETSGNEYTAGFGYRIKNVGFASKLVPANSRFLGDVKLKLDLSTKNDLIVVRNLDVFSNNVTSGASQWNLKFTADYALTQSFSTILFYDHTFSKFEISTAFPATTIRTGFTLRYTF